MKTAGAVVVRSNVRLEAAAAGLEVQSVGDVTWYHFEDNDLNGKFKPFEQVKGRGKVTSEVSVSALFRKLTAAEVRSKKLNWATKQALIASKFSTIRNIWELDEDDECLLQKPKVRK